MKDFAQKNQSFPAVEKFVLKNGLTLLVYRLDTVPKVSVQLWYGVGSKYERAGQRGLAHFLEHMIFKGTEKLSESDIPLVTSKLSGSCNAFTSQDYTGYLFDFPSQHWHEALSILADCMTNCTFKRELFDSEIKAVIQELKMYRDDYEETLSEQMISSIFLGHPYHHPIIGYKQDVWSLERDALLAFYRQHYVPDNATLVVVGSVAVQDVLKHASTVFGAVLKNKNYKQTYFFHDVDTASKTITLYRAIEQPIAQFAFLIPGTVNKREYLARGAAWILCNGRGSRLYKKLIDELQIATDVEALVEDLFDYALFFIRVRPKDARFLAQIEHVIQEEIDSIARNGLSEAELVRAKKNMTVEHLSLFENYQELAYEIGRHFVATGDQHYVVDFLHYLDEHFVQNIHAFFVEYFRPIVMHKGFLLPLPEEEKERWLALQAQEDEQDERVMATLVRTHPIECGNYVDKITALPPVPFSYPKPKLTILDSGLKVFAYNRDGIEMMEASLDLKAKYYYDPEDLQGLGFFVSKMLLEGTEKYSAQELAQAFESRGMSISIMPGFISLSMLSSDFVHGLALLEEILVRPTFDEAAIKKVRGQLLAHLDEFWDKPILFAGQLTKEYIYRGHPYAKNQFGTKESIKRIQRQDIVDFHKKYITPKEANLAIVGNLHGYDVFPITREVFDAWNGPTIATIKFPQLERQKTEMVDFSINRDQVVLRYAGLSVSRLHQDYDKLLIFDQLFTGGVSGSLSCRLFQLREVSGLFYTIGGSLVAGSTKQPGMVVVATIVSLDSLHEAEKLIEDAIYTATVGVTEQEFSDAQNLLANSLVDHFDSNARTAQSFLFLERYGLPADYFDTRAAMLLQVKLKDALKAVQNALDLDFVMKLRIGRLDPEGVIK